MIYDKNEIHQNIVVFVFAYSINVSEYQKYL